MVKYSLMLDTHKGGCQATIEGIKTQDLGSRFVEISFLDGSRPFTVPDGSLATVWAIKPSGSTTYFSADIVNNKLCFLLKTDVIEEAGSVICEARIVSEGKLITAPRFRLIVEDTLYDDEAVEAQDEFSALTEALIRVLEAESGLSSKVDKVDGTPGNLVVFGEDGALKDGGKIPEGGGGNIASYVFVYDSEGTREYDEANKQSFESLIAAVEAGKHISVYIDYDGTLLPGVFDNGDTVASIFPNGNGYVSIRKMTNRIVYSEKENYSGSFSETGIIPASQKATAEWVKAYVDEKLLIDTEVVL